MKFIIVKYKAHFNRLRDMLFIIQFFHYVHSEANKWKQALICLSYKKNCVNYSVKPMYSMHMRLTIIVYSFLSSLSSTFGRDTSLQNCWSRLHTYLAFILWSITTRWSTYSSIKYISTKDFTISTMNKKKSTIIVYTFNWRVEM